MTPFRCLRSLPLFLLLAVLSSLLKAGEFSLRDGTLWCDHRPVLHQVPAEVSLVSDPSGAGVFLKLTAAQSGSYLKGSLGAIDGLRRFTCTYRYEPFWMRPVAGYTHAEIPSETQWLLTETEEGNYVMVVPLLDGPMRFALSGTSSGLTLTADSGDPTTIASGGVAVYLAVGRDPYSLVEKGARAVQARLGTGPMRCEKALPDFTDQFGWCTWNAFYTDVSADKVRLGLASFAAGGVEPRFLILDDGWQSVARRSTGEQRLTSLAPNARFGGDLTPTVRLAKQEFKVRTFLVWHAIGGYWGGVDGVGLPAYQVRDVARSFSPGILKQEPQSNVLWWGPLVGVVPAENIGKFYDDYHRSLRAQGVDGVKVDNQASLEGLATGQGGRVALSRAYREGLEASVVKNFDGRLINCMSNALETYYGSPHSSLIRTSTDFWPNAPATHGAHLYCNAYVGLWFGEFMQPDWDMFESGHPMGSFHAAGRAVSGGPVYVSDKPEAHDFALLRQLVLSDGSILRADQPGRPTPDCLFANPTRDPVLLKIFNTNHDAAIVGVFNANYHPSEGDRSKLSGSVGPDDVPKLSGDEFAAFAHQANRVWRCRRGDREPVTLAEGAWELVSFAPVTRGVAVLGLADKFNSTGAIISKTWAADGTLAVQLRDSGAFLAWTEKPPRVLEANGKAVPFRHDAASGRLDATLPGIGPQAVTLRW